MKEKIGPELRAAVHDGRLLMVTPFVENVKRVSAETAEKRNRFMIELADEVVICNVGSLYRISETLVEWVSSLNVICNDTFTNNGQFS